MKVKVCGLRDPENIKEVASLGPDMIGFIFFPGSPRFVGEELIMPPVPSSVKKVGVFVDAPPAYIIDMIGEHGLDMIQLHGNESPAQCEAFGHLVGVIKAFGIDVDFELKTLDPYKQYCDFFLFDTKTEFHGGSGKKFDHTLLRAYDGSVPFFLSGGIGAEEFAEFCCNENMDLPAGFAGLDLNSRFESGPGIKDIDKLTNALVLRHTEARAAFGKIA
jgi:phosphoribosylanthranilate isomerase